MDRIADFLTRIRNAQARETKEVSTINSKVLEGIAGVLKEEGFLDNYKVTGKDLVVTLKYIDNEPVIRESKRVSKSGVRKYIKYTDIKPYVNGLGIRILSTSKGIMTASKARKLKLGGEILCEIW